MYTGTVKFFTDRGWGFLTADDGSEVFCHVKDVRGQAELEAGQRVQFETLSGPRGVRAVNVELIEG